MENASKALLIAGAILLAILLISLGIMILNQGQDVINNSGMTQAELQTYNSKFTKYEPEVKGSLARSLVQEVIANNSDENNKSAGRIISVTIDGSKLEGDNIVSSGIKNTATYTITCQYTNGRVSNINITKK